MRILALFTAVLCGSASLSAQCPTGLTTLFAANNGGNVGGAVYFDLTVTNPITITSFDINTSVAVGTPIGLTVYTIPGTYVGSTGSSAGWTQVAVDNGTALSNTANFPSSVPLAASFTLAPGSYGMALAGTGPGGSFNHRYTNVGVITSYANADLTITVGAAANVPFTGTPFSPRGWNGTIHYLSNDILTPDFSASVTQGTSPLTTIFTDLSCTTDPGGITAWAWDFNGDNVTDSTMQNPPAFTYGAAGLYDVSLTVTDTAHGSVTETKAGYIAILDNDDCAQAIPLSLGLNGPYHNVGATNSPEGWTCATGGADVWFSFTTPAGCIGTLTVNTCTGTNYDSALQAFDTCGGTSIVCNDDACGTQSEITFPVVPRTTYLICVGGWTGQQGSFSLDVSLGTSGNGTYTNVSAGCGGTTLAGTGTPDIGGSIQLDMTPVAGSPVIALGTTAVGLPICPAGCILGHNLDLGLLPGSSLSGPIPCDPLLVGAAFYAQGIDVGATGGCTAPAFQTSDTILVTIG